VITFADSSDSTTKLVHNQFESLGNVTAKNVTIC